MIDPFSRQNAGISEACALFVPTVKDSRVCAVCRFPLSNHPRTPFFFMEPSSSAYSSLSEVARSATITPITKPHAFLPNSVQGNSSSSKQAQFGKPVLNRSETSAFTQYKKGTSDENSSPDSSGLVFPPQLPNRFDKRATREKAYCLQKSNTFNGLLFKPKPTYLMPLQIEVEEYSTEEAAGQAEYEKEDRQSSRIYRKIKQKHSSQSNGTSDDQLLPSPVSSTSEATVRLNHKKNVPRAHNFKQILDRFQQASDQKMQQQDTNFLNVRYRNNGRNSAEGKLDNNSSEPKNRTLMRRSLIETLPSDYEERFKKEKLCSPPPLTISIPAVKAGHQRHALPERWIEVKETDVDDIPSTPIFSDSSASPPPRSQKQPSSIPASVVLRNVSNSLIMNEARQQHSKLGGSCRRALSGSGFENSREKELDTAKDRPGRIFLRNQLSTAAPLKRPMSPMSSEKKSSSRRSSMTLSMPVGEESTMGIPEPPCPPTPSRSSRGFSPCSIPPPTPVTVERGRIVEETYNQMTLKHTEILASVGERLPEYVRRRDEPFSRNRLLQLNFSDLSFKSYTPSLIKGSSLFFDTYLIRNGQANVDVTIMIAPTSQYLPLSISRRTANESLWCPPVLAEIDDPNREVRRLLQDTNLSGRMVKVFVMPRLNLLSFHSLAAHNLNKTMRAEEYERHVCFIMMQLVCALKSLQSEGVEVLSNNFREFLLAYRYTHFNSPEQINEHPRILLLHEAIGENAEESCRDSVGVCKYALRALCTLLHHKMDSNIPPIAHRSSFSDALLKCAELLHQEKSSSLTEAKNVLEYSFWVGDGTSFDNEFEAKIWLDKQRAEHVNYLLRMLIEDSGTIDETYERLHLQFMLSVTPRTLFVSSETLRRSFC